MQNNFGSLKDHMIKEFSWVVTMFSGGAQHYHLAVNCNVTVATVTTIVTVAFLPYYWDLGKDTKIMDTFP